MKGKDFYGYTVDSNGDVSNKHGRTLKQRNNKGRKEIKLIVDGLRRNLMVSRLVYCAFNNIDVFELSRDKCVTFRDGNKLNIALENLKLVDRADLIQGENHRVVSKLSDGQVEDIIIKYNSTRHNKPINQYDKVKGDYNSYRSLAKEYGVTHPLIKSIIDGKTRYKANYIL